MNKVGIYFKKKRSRMILLQRLILGNRLGIRGWVEKITLEDNFKGCLASLSFDSDV
jgi:hypothetical protein